jgi:hypothetical protein
MKRNWIAVLLPLAALAILLTFLLAVPQPPAARAQSSNSWAFDPCLSSFIPKSSAAISQASATTTQLVALSTGKSIYVCGFVLDIQGSATTVGSLQFESGTGSNCASTVTALTGVMPGNINASVPTVIQSPSDGTGFSTPASTELCVVSAGTTVGITGYVSYVQQ